MNTEMRVIDCSDGISLAVTESASHHHGDDEGEVLDPHIWVSPRNAAVMVENIYRGLVGIDPDHATFYASNRDRFLEELEQLDEAIINAVAGKTTRKFIVHHPAWGHLASHYGLQQVPIEVQGKEPSVRSIIDLVSHAKMHDIRVVFASPQFNIKTTKVIAGEIKGSVVIVDPLARNYTENLAKVIEAFSQSMR
jgi:zinc transport system substrate-binding protein